jgi:error-prone DNA polymerase
LLNSQPMGFYSPSQIVQDAQRHGIAVRPVDVRYSEWDCTLEPDSRRHWTIRLGFRQVRGCSEPVGLAISAARAQRVYDDIADLCARANLDKRHQDLLAEAGALRGIAGHRHRAQWAIAGVEPQLPLFGHDSPPEASVVLPPPTQADNTLADYARVGLTLGPHPLQQIRGRLRVARCTDSKSLKNRRHESWVRVAGLVTLRQRPQTASGVTFLTMEDEHGLINVIVWRQVAEEHRRQLLESQLLGVEGQWQMVDGTCHVVARRLLDLSSLLGGLDTRSRDFR